MYSALKIHMSESAHDALKAFPEFITEPRGETLVKVNIYTVSLIPMHRLYRIRL